MARIKKKVIWTQRNAKATVPAALAEGMTTAVPAACASDLGVAAGRQGASARDGGQNTRVLCLLWYFGRHVKWSTWSSFIEFNSFPI